MSSNQQQRELARRLAALTSRVNGLSAPQLGNSSLEGRPINSYDQNGQLSGIIGQQWDGSHGFQAVNGPMPPTPSTPIVEPVLGGLRIRWDGEWLDTVNQEDPNLAPTPTFAPLDFLRVEVHVGTTPVGLGLLAPRTTIESPRGGEVVPAVSYDTDYYVRLVCRTTSGRVSLVSPAAGPIRALKATKEDLEVDFDALRGTMVFYGPDEPETEFADLWLKTPATPAGKYTAWRFNPLALNGVGMWEELRDQGVVEALQKATEAGQAAEEAGLAALAAQGAAGDAQEAAGAAQQTADAKTATFRQDSPPSTTGRTLGDEWIETDQNNRRWTWTAAGWTLDRLGAGAISATARQLGAITTYRQASAPASGMIVGDFWIDSDDNVIYRYEGSTPTWVKSQDININTAIQNAATAKAIADGKMRIFPQASAPTGLTADDVGDMWIDTDDSNVTYTWALISGTTYGWVKRQIGNGAIQPMSLVARDVVATGTVSASLLEAVMILASEIIAGDPLGSHARMTPTGFRVYRADPIDGVPDEVVRMGTETNDYFGIVDSAGNLVAAIDDTGRATFREVNTSKLLVAGRDVALMIEDGPRGEVAHFLGSPGFDLAPIFNPVGVAEVGFPVYRGRSYLVKWRMSVFANAGVQIQSNFRWSQGAEGDTITQAPAPTVNSTSFAEWRHFPAGDNKVQTISGEALFVPAFTSRVRFGLTAQTGSDGNIGYVGVANRPVEINVTDVGVHIGRNGQFSNMGGNLNGQVNAPPPVSVQQQYFADLAPVGRMSWNGAGQHMNWVGGDVYQGYQGANGNTRGQFWFDLPNITGTVDRVDVWMYFRHWHFNSGGNVRMGLTDQRGVFTDHSFKALWETGGWPKPGGREVLLPSDWWPMFKGTNNNSFNGRATVISIGPGVGTNQIHYGVATDARLRIYYTQ